MPVSAHAVLAPRPETKSAESESGAGDIRRRRGLRDRRVLPFDRRAVAPAIQFPELLPADFNLAPLEGLIRACTTARDAHPDDDG